MDEEYGYEGIEEQYFTDPVPPEDNNTIGPDFSDYFDVPGDEEPENDEPEVEAPDILGLETDGEAPAQDDRGVVPTEPITPPEPQKSSDASTKEDEEPETDKPDDTGDSKGKKVKGVDKTGEHESLWNKIKNGVKKIKEFFQNASEAIRTRDISMFKAWVYGGKRLVNTLVETDITNNAIKQKEALAINESLAAQVKELEAKLAEMQIQKADEPNISNVDIPTSEEKTTETPIIQVSTESMRESIDSQKEKIRDYAGALEAAKAEETPDTEKIAKLSEGLLEQYAILSTVFENIKDVLNTVNVELSSSPEEISQFAESLQADVEEMSGIVTEVFKTEIEEEELSEPDVEEHLEDDAPSTPGVKEKIEILNEQAHGAADILAAELGATTREDPSSTIDKNGPSFDDDM